MFDRPVFKKALVAGLPIAAQAPSPVTGERKLGRAK